MTNKDKFEAQQMESLLKNPALRNTFEEAIANILKDFAGQNSNDNKGHFGPSAQALENNLPINQGLRQVEVYSSPNILDGKSKSKETSSGVTIGLVSDPDGLKKQNQNLLNGTYLETTLNNNGTITIKGILDDEKGNRKRVELVFTLGRGKVGEIE